MKSAVHVRLSFMSLCVFLFITGILLVSACSGQSAKPPAGEKETAVAAQTVSGEVRSIAGSWRTEVSNGRGTWIFHADGTCTLRDPGAQERKARYTYAPKELVIISEFGSTRYTITENNEPRLKLLYRWGDSYDINITLVRMKE